jgi:hypothetical protein
VYQDYGVSTLAEMEHPGGWCSIFFAQIGLTFRVGRLKIDGFGFGARIALRKGVIDSKVSRSAIR